MSDLKTTLRLPRPLADDATAYAAGVGVSLNALCAIALRDYLDARKGRPLPAEPVGASVVPASSPAGAGQVPKVAKGQPCPCGSRKPYGKCHGRSA